jgi:TPR repeat protein
MKAKTATVFIAVALVYSSLLAYGQVTRSFSEVDRLASGGDRPDMVGVRALYQRYGFGTPQSFAAVERDVALKDARHPFCLYNLAVLTFNRVGMASNPDIAARLRQQGEQLYSEAVPGLTKLADQGDPFAQLMLGGCYESGHGGLSEDPERAYSLYLEAAKGDFPIAWYNLADMLLKGKGTTRNPSAAIRLMEKAAEAGAPVAKYGLAQAYFEGNGVQKSTGRGFAYPPRKSK